MNSICRCLRSSLSQKFKIEVDVYVSKKKELKHISFLKLLLSYSFFEDLIDYIKNYWQKRKFFYPGYYFIYPKINQSLKWRFDYVFIVINKPKDKKRNGGPIRSIFWKLRVSFAEEFPRYIVKVSQVKGSFYVLVRKLRGKILNNDLEILFKYVKSISNKIYNKFSEDSGMFCYSFLNWWGAAATTTTIF